MRNTQLSNCVCRRLLLGCLLAGVIQPQPVPAIDIVGVQNAALDQPRIYALFRRTPDGPPLTGTDPFFGDEFFGIEAFFDTGASGLILSESTADLLGIQRAPGVVFEDVGIGGSAEFNVSEPLFIDLAPFTPSADVTDPDTAASVYTQRFGPLRTQIGPLGAPPSPFGGVDVLGVPTMQGKVVVMDPAPLDTLSATMNTYVYDPGTPFKPATLDSDPGIPHTNRTVALSSSSFEDFTRLTPAAAEPPALLPNPFIGPDPLQPAGGDTPGITISLGERQTTGSFLLDTGAFASVISEALAADLHVRYREGELVPTLESFDPANPQAPGTELENQFLLTLGGIGGQQQAAGFFLDEMLVRTQQGNALDDDDPAHLRYLGAPVLVSDISVAHADTGEIVTLDGLFGMNFLVASVFFSEPLTFGEINASPFRWVVFDHTNGVLGVSVIPEPQTVLLVVAGLGLVGWRMRKVAR